ncbi:MAG: LytTR family DNA-binding domain-containing protein, partial [Saprospiraceae bacterium]|nr:LytTR family DNA-binding domain-containing protein [Saprospiraceae bacterium]
SEAIAHLQTQTIDLIFLDINMPELSGLKFRSVLGDEIMIIFTTAHPEHALESYELNAIDYLLKPVPFDRFLKAVVKARARRDGAPPVAPAPERIAGHRIYVKSGSKHYQLKTSEILFLKKEGNYIAFHTKDKKVLSRLNMKQVLELLPGDLFMRVHKSYIVALLQIDLIDKRKVDIAGQKIPVAKKYFDELIERLS